MPQEKLLMTKVHADKDTPSFPLKGSAEVSLSTTTAQSSALRGNIVLVRPTTECYIAWGSSPTATVGTGDGKAWCPSTEWTEIHIADGDKVAGILAAGTGTLYIRYPKVQAVG